MSEKSQRKPKRTLTLMKRPAPKSHSGGSPKAPPPLPNKTDTKRGGPPPIPKASSTRIRGMRILVIGDDPTRVEALAEELSKLDAETATGDRGDQGYSKASEFKPDAVISELASPGEQGWRIVQQLRRHPLLRWTPVLMLRWWEKPGSGKERVLLGRVLDRLEEALAPLRVFEDRISAKGALSDRIEITGVPPLLRLFSRAKMEGVLSINDSWNVFDVHMRENRLLSVTRRGVDGRVDSGVEAFIQLLLCDSGGWQFRSMDTDKGEWNIDQELDKVLNEGSGVLSKLFGPEREADRRGPNEKYRVSIEAMTDAAPAMPSSIRKVAESIIAGEIRDDVETMLGSDKDPLFAERAVQTLIRCGAIRLSVDPSKQPKSPQEERATQIVAYLLKGEGGKKARKSKDLGIIAGLPKLEGADSPRSVPSERDAVDGPEGGTISFGSHTASKAKPERLSAALNKSLKVLGMAAKNDLGARSHETTPMSALKAETAPEASEPDNTESVLHEGLPDTAARRESVRKRMLLASSKKDDRSRPQMWIAIALAVILTGIMAAGLVLVGTNNKEPPSPVSGK